jgi:hypothetical protein
VPSALPLARISPCCKEILILARNLQGNEFSTRKWQGKILKLKELQGFLKPLKPVKINL